MIVVGYQGIGKSTVSKDHLNCIDLESSNFWVDGKRNGNWYIEYAQIADHLSKQGYIVFTSSHKVVRDALSKISNEDIVCIVPSLDLKNDWIVKLYLRYNDSQLDKDYKAYMNAKDRYEENINEILNSGFPSIEITNLNYDLYSIIDSYKNKDKPFNEIINKILYDLNTRQNTYKNYVNELSEKEKREAKTIVGRSLEIQDIITIIEKYVGKINE